MIIQKLEEIDKVNDTFVKLNNRAVLLESKIKDIKNEFALEILHRLNDLFTIYKQKCHDKDMQSNLFILEIAIQELCMVLEKVITKQ